jgi:hypothetical protein
MKLFTKEISEKLVKAGYNNMRPICKLFTPWGQCTWLVTGEEDGILYGYGDLGMGCVEWGGLFTKEEVEAIRGPAGLKIERDLHFTDDPSINWLEKDSLVGC